MGGILQASRLKSLGFFFLSLFVVLFLPSITGKELKFAVIIFRHGDRTPFESFPTDLYTESDWPQGFGQLTQLGMQQHYELGQHLRKRYANLLSIEYQRKENFFLSTDYDRTIMSALATLAGIFPPTGRQIWNSQIPWQPIPVHTVPQSQDCLHTPFPNCPRYNKILAETLTSKIFQKALQPHMNILNTMATYTGYDVATLRNLTNWKAWNIHDTLKCEIIHKYALPSWVTNDVMAQMGKLSDLTFWTLFGIYKKKEKSQLQGGVLVKAVLQELTAVDAFENKRKLMAYSAHATTIAAFQMALNIYNGKVPPFASCQFIELYKDFSGQYFVEMYFRNDTTREPYQLRLPGCTFSCPLAKFTQLVSPVIVENWTKACENEANPRVSSVPVQKWKI